MHQKAKDALLNRIAAVAEQVTDDPDTFAHARWWEFDGHPTIGIAGEAAQELQSIVEKLASRSEWTERFSVEYLDSRLVIILVAAHRQGRDEAVRLLDEFVDELESFATEQRVFIPISGLVLMVPELKVGRVTIRKGTPAGISAESEVGKYLADRVHAEFQVIAEPIKAGEHGSRETRRALEALTFVHVANTLYGIDSDAVISTESERLAPAAWVGVVSTTEAYFQYRRRERATPVLISSGSLSELNSHGLPELSEMLARDTGDLSELEETILWAVHWLATAQAQIEEENRLLNLTTCLEALVGPLDPKTDPISGTIAEAVALIAGSGYEDRTKIRSFVIDQYRARSGVSHGRRGRVAASDVRQLRAIVVNLIKRLLAVRDEVQDRKALFAWLERTRLGGALASPGETRTIAELRAEHGLSFMQLVHELGCQPEELDQWERTGPDLAAMRRIVNTLNVPIERTAPPRNHQLMNHAGHRFLLGVRRQGDRWIAKVGGYDWNDAQREPCRPVDPDHQHSRSPSIIATAGWTFEADHADSALEGLRRRIDAAMKRALTTTRLPDDPEDWQPPDECQGKRP
jgi:hypothetical protein